MDRLGIRTDESVKELAWMRTAMCMCPLRWAANVDDVNCCRVATGDAAADDAWPLLMHEQLAPLSYLRCARFEAWVATP